MTRLYIFAEGQTEEAFVKGVIAEHLRAHGIGMTIPIRIRGGFWKTWARTIRRVIGEQRGADVRFSTLVDLYGLPRGFPAIADVMAIADTRRRAAAVEAQIEEAFDDSRLLPYVQLHEFEALVLAGLDEIGWIFDGPQASSGLAALKAEIGDIAPEDVNDGADTAPSKRLAAHIPGYSKIIHGEMATATIGLGTLREACPRFGTWLSRLEGLGG